MATVVYGVRRVLGLGGRKEGNRAWAGDGRASTQGTGATQGLHGHQGRGSAVEAKAATSQRGLEVLRRLWTWLRCNDDEKAMFARRHGRTDLALLPPPTSHPPRLLPPHRPSCGTGAGFSERGAGRVTALITLRGTSVLAMRSRGFLFVSGLGGTEAAGSYGAFLPAPWD